MTAVDGWTINKKLDDISKELKDYILYIGGRLLELEERLDKLDGKKRKTSKGDA
tara:strand:+ start:1322 stop:1483 length:162 start_codon:yes stop_codon:yes gene_type:complete